jgi:hypothetical protein
LSRRSKFFVATAPEHGGHVNLSPKGINTFRALGPNRVAYLDATGGGNETAAHLLQNGRITFMFCAFEATPKIMRLYGSGRAISLDSTEAADLLAQFAPLPGARQIITAEISRVQTSCGFGVPLMRFQNDRDALLRWLNQKLRRDCENTAKRQIA